MQELVYHSHEIQAWEQRWFHQQNSDYGLMQQVAWTISQRVIALLEPQTDSLLQNSHCPNKQCKADRVKIAVCCGNGNNAGDGYLVAHYLNQHYCKENNDCIDVYASKQAISIEAGASESLIKAHAEAKNSGLKIIEGFNFELEYDVYIDALFGIGLNRELDEVWQKIIHSINAKKALKIAIDIPSGLDCNTGQPLNVAIKADHTFTALGLKAGLFTGHGKEYAGKVETIALIPKDPYLKSMAQLSSTQISLPTRQAFGHKGSYGHVLIVGGHADMGGAVIMAAEAAFSAGAGKVSVVCDAKHHGAILARSPNIMVRDINALSHDEISELIDHVDAIGFGMGLGRDLWAEQVYLKWINLLNDAHIELVLDADALWFLALNPLKLKQQVYLTPHPGEAAKLLNSTVAAIEKDRIQAIHQLQQKYSGQWVLKGAGSLVLQDPSDAENNLWICTAGNAGMGTGGMGDVLAGLIASLKAQFKQQIQLNHIVTLHALAGDYLAEQGMRGLQAQQMNQAIYHIVNQ